MNSDSFRALSFFDLFQVEEMQCVQDAFAQSSNVASIITSPDGTPLTMPSNVCARFVSIVQGREDFGRAGVFSDAVLGPFDTEDPVIRVCPATGLLHAGARILVGGNHVANWIVGHVRNEVDQMRQLLAHAESNGFDRESFAGVMEQLPLMSSEQFGRVADSMALITGHIFQQAYRIQQLGRTEFKEDCRPFREKEEHFRVILDSVNDAVFVQEWPGGKLVDTNEHVGQMFGYTREELLQLSFADLCADKQAYDVLIPSLLDKTREGGVQVAQLHVRSKSGEVFWVEASLRLVQLGDKSCIVACVRDIEARMCAETEIIRERRFSDAVIDSVPGLLYLYDEKGCLVRWNRQHSILTGYSDEELAGMNLYEWYRDDPESIEKVSAAIARVFNDGIGYEEAMLQTKSGKRLPFFFTAVRFEFEGKNYFTGIGIDISERRDAELALQESEARYRSVIENIQDTFYRTDAGGALIMLSPSGACLLGYDDPEELLGTSMEKLWKSAEAFQAYVQILSEQGAVRGLEATLLRKDGSEVLVEATSNIYSDDSGFMLGLEGILRDITERKKTEELLRQSENKFSRLFRHSPDAILLADIDTGIVSEVNETFVTMMGFARDEIIGKTTDSVSFYVDPALRGQLYAILRRDGLLTNQELMVRTRDGRTLVCALLSHVMQIGEQRVAMSVFRDITELKKMQEMMIQAEKMLSVGGIAAGIAHEINNPLGIIMQSAQLLELRTLTSFPKNIAAAEKIGLDLRLLECYMNERNIPTCVRDIREAAKRAADIIRHMLDFSRRSDSDRKFCFVNEIIDRAITMAGSDYDLRKSFDFKRIQVIRDFTDPMPGIQCCETEIEQVVLNLLRNAAQAMGDVSDVDPVITVRTRVIGENIVIEVEDNGPGIPSDTARRIFEPFFTTKPPGQGTGLGLSVSYYIVTQTHGGNIHVRSVPGRGACFYVEIPKAGPVPKMGES
jgi:PAS domain S-box-containing protein